MSQTENPDAMDRLIDQAMASYTVGEPDPQLAARIAAATRMMPGDGIRSSARARMYATAACLAIVTMLSVWMKWQHVQIAIVHKPTTRSITPIQVTRTAGNSAVEVNPQRGTVARASVRKSSGASAARRVAGGDTRAAKDRRRNDPSTTGEQLLAEGVEPIVLKPIVIPPIRLGTSSQE